MPFVTVEMLAGRSLEQRREMVKKITEVLVETIDCKPEAVTITIKELDKRDLAKNGKLMCD